MKNTTDKDVRFQNSANLFKFCRRVLDQKFGGIRVIDQDVGQILDFDPADCSHWKNGKKQIRSIQAMRAISDHLAVDEQLIVSIATGDLNHEEAYQEYLGYGNFEIDEIAYEKAKKEYYRQNASSWTRQSESEFKSQFDVSKEAVLKIVEDIHNKINFKEAPLYIPEILSSYTEIIFEPQTGEVDDYIKSTHLPNDEIKISFKEGTDIKPFMRYQLAKVMAPYFFKKAGLISSGHGHVDDVRASFFAANLIAPEGLIRNEIKKLGQNSDLITQLAEIFWVSRKFMNLRLKNILSK